MYTVGLVSTRFKGNSELLDVVPLFGLGGGERGEGCETGWGLMFDIFAVLISLYSFFMRYCAMPFFCLLFSLSLNI